MQPSIRHSLGMLIVAQSLAALSPPAARIGVSERPGQAGPPTACSVIDAEQLKRLTGRRDGLRRGPQPEDPSMPGKGRTSCSYLEFQFELVSPAQRESFDRARSSFARGVTKVQPVSGVGDAAFYWWDPRPGVTRPVGILLRAGTSELMIMDMTSPDSVEVVKPQLLAVAKAIVPKLR